MNASSSTAAAAASLGAPTARRRFGAMVIGSMGVVFGDIGTSPL
jgi:K+ transporter